MKFSLYFGFIFTVLSGTIYFPTIEKLIQSFPDHPQKNIITILILTLPALFASISSLIVGTRVETHEKKKIIFYALATFGTLGFLALSTSNIIEVLVIRIFIGLSIGAIAAGFTSLLLEGKKAFGRIRSFPNILIFLFATTFSLFVLNSWLAESHWKIAHFLHLLAFAYLPFFTIYIFESKETLTSQEHALPKVESEKAILEKKSIHKTLRHNFIFTFIIGITLFLFPRYLSTYLLDSFPYLESITGKLITLVVGATIIGAWWTRRASLQQKAISIEVLSLLCLGSSYTIFAFFTIKFLFFLALILLGFGVGVFFANIFAWTVELSISKHYSKNISKIISLLYLSQFIGPFIIWFSLEKFGIQSILQVTSSIIILLLIIDIFGYFKVRNETSL